MVRARRRMSATGAAGDDSSPTFRIRKVGGRWLWRCTFCHPPTHGGGVSFERVILSLRRHEFVYRYHHVLMARFPVRRSGS